MSQQFEEIPRIALLQKVKINSSGLLIRRAKKQKQNPYTTRNKAHHLKTDEKTFFRLEIEEIGFYDH